MKRASVTIIVEKMIAKIASSRMARLIATPSRSGSAVPAVLSQFGASSPQKKWYEPQNLDKYVRRAKDCDPGGHCGTRVPPAYPLKFTDERILVIRDFDVRGFEPKHGGDHA
jgi:hypothetical protein